MIPAADLTATATLVIAGVTLALAVAVVALVLVTRAGAAQARDATKAELDVLKRQLAAGYRPLLVDVLTTAPPPADMGAEFGVERTPAAGEHLSGPGPIVQTKLPGIEPTYFDPRTVFVKLDAARVFLSVPLRNAGRGLAVIDALGVEVSGPGLGEPEYRDVQRQHVPVNETTRIDLVTSHSVGEPTPPGALWTLRVPYSDVAGEQRTVVILQLVRRGADAEGPWLIERADQEPARDQKPPADELPDAGATARPSGVRGEQITDLWGQPITKRPRNR